MKTSLASALNGGISKTADESCEIWRSCLANSLVLFTATLTEVSGF